MNSLKLNTMNDFASRNAHTRCAICNNNNVVVRFKNGFICEACIDYIKEK